MEFLRRLGERHEALKKKIHATRIPLSKNGQRVMGLVYFTTPIIGGYYVMKWAERRADVNFQREEPEIRRAAGSNARYVAQQNQQLKKMLQDKQQ
ncbi:hypothetical protein GN244_ATG08135 [Phytophthora infestans]|uniref:Uncharacterized protein n=1 Tax=Phytophthora infestans TaxID=4787 RepID=A0A833TEW5_PHYIN|nr:hypothetical protein GN244_ATG08135 [Phytophthora infestans]KAF4147922.1 hypothetical protein GN958_ATG02884 [Phytophthora infestans]KAI9987533.1 hypothetical protein PInf_023574 [Phytophthora infestans]